MVARTVCNSVTVVAAEVKVVTGFNWVTVTGKTVAVCVAVMAVAVTVTVWVAGYAVHEKKLEQSPL